MKRQKFAAWCAQLPAGCVVAMEACSGAHHWARRLTAIGLQPRQLPWLDAIGRPVPKRRIPAVLTVAEVQLLLGFMEGDGALLARLLYGSGMRLMEALSVRVKDAEFERCVIIVREGKGAKDRVVMLPRSLEQPP